MTRYSKKNVYKLKDNPLPSDYVLGSDDQTQDKVSKNFQLSDIRNMFLEGLSPETGGNLKFQEFFYNGLPKTPEEVANFKNPAYPVSQYEIVFFNVNGVIYILKKQNFSFGVTETPLTNSDFILITDFGKLGDGVNVLKGYNGNTKKFEFYGITGDGMTINLVGDNINIQQDEGNNLGSGQVLYKGLNGSSKVHEFYSLASTGLDISLNSSTILIEKKASTKLGSNGIDVYKGFNPITKLDEFRKIKSNTLSVTLDSDGVKIEKTETYVQAGTGTTINGTGTESDPYIISANSNIGWKYGDIKTVYCDSTYLGVNFDGTGLGRIDRVDWAIINGNNGTVNIDGLTIIGYGATYNTLNATGGSKDSVVVQHNHNLRYHKVPSSLPDSGHEVITVDSGTDGINTENTGVDGTGKNMQPYIVMLQIMYVGD